MIDTYVFCFSEHNPEEKDGRLSMWRGYGGQGNGAAIIFDSAKINKNENNPIQLAKVEYGSVTRRMEFIDKVSYTIKLIIEKMNIADEDIWQLSYGIFERLKTFALFTKHHGFSEEKEWRAVYFAERDQKGFFENMKHYHNGPRGVEPKLKLKIAPLDGVFDENFVIRKIISSIILGPSTSTPLAVRSVERMFDKLNHSELKERLHPSSIPLRPMG